MPPRYLSRHTFTEATKFSDLGEDELFLTEREAFFFEELRDNRFHVVQEGDTLYSLAGRYFKRFRRPAGLWWVIADFQTPTPIHDPTIRLTPGTVLIIPSDRTVEERIFAESRRPKLNRSV